MQTIKDTQLTVNNEGQVFYQADASNPLPGVPVATLRKGAAALAPEIVATVDILALPVLQEWLQGYIARVLEPLVALSAAKAENEAVQGICEKVYEAMGIVPREALEGLIAKLDPELRRDLRDRKIRLGPILVFQPDLNKPAAVRLRALLWSLFNDKPLPPPVPHDGVVSIKVDTATIDRNFYQAIGYPVYGARAIRIDMLDRVINAVYDSAQGGKFKAQHQMAEWLGCPIADLYAVLEAMGHKKAFDPAEQAPQTEDAKPEEAQETVATATPAVTEVAPAVQKDKIKPELATFYLKKGKAFASAAPRRERKPQAEGDKKFRKDKKPAHRADKKSGRKPEKKERIMSAGPKARPEDSPFAILGQLKVKSDGG
jgi:ATP-dependent RNA helicase SUPV3L1/SUV3